MKHSICLITILLFHITFNAYAVCQSIYGSDPLNPNPQSPLGQYLNNSGATSVERAFPVEHNGAAGETRLVVTISQVSYPEFEAHFVNDNILYLFHDPNSRIINIAYNGKKGFMGRLTGDMRFTFSGAVLIPICLTEEEKVKVKDFFALTAKVSQANDFALYPWLLTDISGTPYMPVGNHDFTEWFMRLPMGEIDSSTSYSAYELPQVNQEVQNILQRVWIFPHGSQSLKNVLGLRRFVNNRTLNTPGLIASSLLANVSSARIPAVFRYVNDHLEQLPADFNTWFDINFDPNNTHIMLKEYMYENILNY